MRLRKKHLPHRATIEALAGDSAEGPTAAEPISAVPCYFEQKARLVIDRRATSPTVNTEVMTSTFGILLLANDVLPGAYITIWAGTPRERRAQVISSELFIYPRTPGHVEVWTD